MTQSGKEIIVDLNEEDELSETSTLFNRFKDFVELGFAVQE